MASSIRNTPLWPGLKNLAYFTIGLTLCFAQPLWRLLKFCLHSDLFSYIPLIPCITVYLVWLKKDIFSEDGSPPRPLALLPSLGAAGIFGWYFASLHSGWRPATGEMLTVMMLAYLLLFWAGCLFFVPSRVLRQIIFPLALLIFIVPLPAWMVIRIDIFFQHASAMMAHAFFAMVGTPIFQHNLELQLPDITLTVAPECSGIHSTLVLLITSLLAAYLFLAATWKRALLVLIVIPLAILRNGFRIFVIGELCVHLGPQMIDSAIHRQGGPIFFALSLIPFFLFLFYLRRAGWKKPLAVPQTRPNSL
jgi:exosortase C (VPDSG-CTERM-specific)